PGRQAADQDAVLDQVGAAGRQSLARDPLGAEEAGQRAVIEDRELGRGDASAELAEERRARRIERARGARRHDDVVQEIRHGLPPEDDLYSPEGTRSPPIAAIAFVAASTPASSVKWSRRVPVNAPEPLAPCDSTIAVTNAVISVD